MRCDRRRRLLLTVSAVLFITFLSAEQVLNLEAFEPTKNDAAAVVDTMGPTCVSSYEPFVLRLRALYGIGWVYRQKDRNDEAITQFDKVTRLQPDYGDAHLARGDIRAERHQFIEAIADYNKAIVAYEQQLRYLNAAIAAAEAKSGSRVAQAEKKRTERDKARVEVVMEHARKAKAEVENELK